MKDGKIDFKSVGIAAILAITGIAVGMMDFTAQKTNILKFLAETLQISTDIQVPQTTDVFQVFGFSGIAILVLMLAVVCISFMMYGLRGMA